MESPEKLSERASDECSDPANSLHLSAASLWEIQIKSQLGKLALDVPLSDIVKAEVTNANDAKLLSRNRTDFDKVPGLRVEDWLS